jgi:hypothetical protein
LTRRECFERSGESVKAYNVRWWKQIWTRALSHGWMKWSSQMSSDFSLELDLRNGHKCFAENCLGSMGGSSVITVQTSCSVNFSLNTFTRSSWKHRLVQIFFTITHLFFTSHHKGNGFDVDGRTLLGRISSAFRLSGWTTWAISVHTVQLPSILLMAEQERACSIRFSLNDPLPSRS